MIEDTNTIEPPPAGRRVEPLVGRPMLRWIVLSTDPITNKPREYRLCFGRRKPRCVATVWENGTWHTWDKNGVGGENSVEIDVRRAKIEASASAIEQGFV